MSTILSARVSNNDVLMREVRELYLPYDYEIADVTYGNGVFWRDIDTSKFKRFIGSDISTGIDFRRLPYRDASLDAVVLDPPYAYNPKSTIKESLSSGYKLNESGVDIRTTEDVLRLYAQGMHEARRILRPNGVLLVKCKDGIESGAQRWEHIQIFNIGVEKLGMIARDLFVLVQPTTPCIRWKQQKSARKNHSYMWVFKVPKRPRK